MSRKPVRRQIYQITGDNLDLEVRTKFMTLSSQNKSLHWFNMVATKDRVPILNPLPLYNVVEHNQPSIYVVGLHSIPAIIN